MRTTRCFSARALLNLSVAACVIAFGAKRTSGDTIGYRGYWIDGFDLSPRTLADSSQGGDFYLPLFDPNLGTFQSTSWQTLGNIATGYTIPLGGFNDLWTAVVITSYDFLGQGGDSDFFDDDNFFGASVPTYALLQAAGSGVVQNSSDSYWIAALNHTTSGFHVEGWIVGTSSNPMTASTEFSGVAVVNYTFIPATSNSNTTIAVGVNSPELTTTLSINSSRTFGTLTIGSNTDPTSIGVVNLIAGGSLSLGVLDVNRYGTFNQTAGTLSLSGTATIGQGGTGGTFNLTGGIATINSAVVNNLGAMNMSGGTLTASTGITVNVGGKFHQTGGTLSGGAFTNNGTSTHTGGSVGFASVAGTGSMQLQGVTVTTGAFRQGPTSISGTVTFASAGGARQTPAVMLHFGSLSIASNSTLDSTNRDLMIGNSSIGTVETQILAGLYGVLPNGNPSAASDPMITSSTVIGNGNTILIPIDADAILGNGSAGSAIGLSWDGVTISDASTIIVKYTWAGDADLDGKVDYGDYGPILANINQSTPGLADIQTSWLMGDLDFSGTVDTGDYGPIVATFGQGVGSPLGTLEAPIQVPEPASLLLLATASFILGARKYRLR